MNSLIMILDSDYRRSIALESFFIHTSFHTMRVAQVDDAKSLLRGHPIKLAIINQDHGINGNGYEYIRFMREHYPDIGIIVLSDNSSPMDRILGIEMGADDYLVRPVDMRELMARIRRLLERLNIYSFHLNSVINFSGFGLDRQKREVTWITSGKKIHFTNREYDMLLCLLENANRVVGRNTLAQVVCGRSWHAEDRSVDVTISSIRCKLRQHNPADTLIRSIRGTGYSLIIRHE
ncbi:MAG: response regulator transcription factor [Ferrovum sp.]|nr:response regulator transcription factor [Ferrovum sp.]